MLWIYCVPALCLLVCLPLFMHYKSALRYPLASCFKCLGTLCAASLVLIAAIKLDPRCWICFAGVMLHTVADWLLEFNMYVGAGFFLAGHVCYIAFFTKLFPITSVQLICAVFLLAVTVFCFYRWRKAIGSRMVPMSVYALALGLMTACAIGGLTAHTLQGQLIAIGGALFFISDSLICARLLFTAGKGVDWVIMVTYYAAQLLFGIACLQ